MKRLKSCDRDGFRLLNGNVRVRRMANFSQLSSLGVLGDDWIAQV